MDEQEFNRVAYKGRDSWQIVESSQSPWGKARKMKANDSSWAQCVPALVWQAKRFGLVLGNGRKSEYCLCILDIKIWIM